MDQSIARDAGLAAAKDAQSSSSTSSDRQHETSANASAGSSTAASRTPSKVLADRFQVLDAQWVDHKAKSPIKIVRARRIRRKHGGNSVASASTLSHAQDDTQSLPATLPLHQQQAQRRRPEPSPGMDHLDRSARIQASAAAAVAVAQEDDMSVGNSTISTLSSTESVFDRLHRTGIRSPKAKAKKKKQLVSPITNKPRIRNRLEAYETKSLGGEIAGGGGRTPKRGTARNLFFTNEEEGLMDSSPSSSVYARLYRNEKRPEKLWTKPPAFTPKLSNTRQTQETSFDNADMYSPQPSAAQLDEDFSSDAFLSSSLPIIDTTLEQDLAEINRLGKSLGTGLDDSSPTVTATSVSTNVTPTISTHYNLAAAARMDPTVDEEFSMLEAVGKQLDRMEQDQMRFLSAGEPARFALHEQPPPRNEDATRTKQSAAADSQTESTCGASDAFGFFTLDNHSRSYFFADKIDRLTSPIRRRRKRAEKKTGSSDTIDALAIEDARSDSEPLMTPRRLRLASSITLQRAWRMHTAELELASLMITSWKASFWPLGVRDQLPCATRQEALGKAITSVGCWWIIEGVHIEDHWTTIAWEKQFLVDNMQMQVNFDCEAQLLALANLRWDRRKLAMLLVKAGLRKVLCGERAALRVQLWYRRRQGKLNRTAAQLQEWARKALTERRKQKHSIAYHQNDVDADHVQPEVIAMDSPSNSATDTSLDSCNLRDEVMDELPSPAPGYSEAEHVAAIKIQSWLRVATLKRAIKQWPSTMKQLRSALKTAGPSQDILKPSFDAFDAARSILYSTMVARRLGGVQFSFLEEVSVDNGVAKRAAALAIHNIVRAYISGLKRFRDKQRVIRIQSLFRGYSARKELERRHFAAVVIQFAWSNYRYFTVKTRNAIAIQSFWRMAYCASNYRLLVFCIIFLQANWRCALDRRRFLSQKNAALLLQRCWRGSRLRRPFLMFRSAIVALQQSFQKKRTIAIYKWHCQNALILQTAWRVHDARSLLFRSLSAATFVQAAFRRSCERKRFCNLRKRAVSIQKAWRYYCWQKRMLLERMCRSSVLIQSIWRTSSVRADYHQKLYSATYLQKVVRGRMARLEFKTAIIAATSIESAQRMLRCQQMYRTKLFCMIQIQSTIRMIIARSSFRASVFALATIQRVWRGYSARLILERRRWDKAISSATRMQNRWRTCTAQDTYVRYRVSTMLIQSLVRMTLARRTYSFELLERQKYQSSVKIQALARGRLAQRSLQVHRDSAIAIQTIYRGSLARTRLRSLAFIATLIQRNWRRSKYVSLFKHKTESIIMIQAIWRGSAVREVYNEARVSAIVIQAFFRAGRDARKYHYTRNEMRQQRQKKASILIQRTARMHLAEKDFHDRQLSVKIIQSAFRMASVRSEYEMTRLSIVMIQSLVRGQLMRSLISHQNCAATKLQTLWRRSVAERHLQKLHYARIWTAAIIIQKQWRAVLFKIRYLETRDSIVVIQASIRGFSQRKAISTRVNAERCAAVLIQRHYRGYSSRLEANLQNSAALLLQTQWRRAYSLSSFSTSRQSAVQIQSLLRGYLLRQQIVASPPSSTPSVDYVIKCTTLIQVVWRGAIARDSYVRSRIAAITIQAVFRGSKVRQEWWFVRLLDGNRIIFDACARKIQIAFALWKLELAVWEMKSLSVLLHRGVRAQLDRSVVEYALFHMTSSMHTFASKSYFQLAASQEEGAAAMILWHRAIGHARNSAAVVIQSYVRGTITRRDILKVRGVSFTRARGGDNVMIAIQWAATRIQRAVQMWLLLRLIAVINIQRKMRAWMARSQLQKLKARRNLMLNEAATMIQAYQRRSRHCSQFLKEKQAAINIQSAFRSYYAAKSFDNLRTSLLNVQLWYRERRRMRESRMQAAAVAAVAIQSVWRMTIQQKRFQVRKAALAELRETIISRVASTASAGGSKLVEELLAGDSQDKAPCLTRLAARVSYALEDAENSKRPPLKQAAT